MHYSILTLFFTLIIIFRNSSKTDLFITVLYLFIGTATVGDLFFLSQPIAVLPKQEIANGQLIGYALNVSLIVLVSVIFFKSSRHRKMATQENLRELVSVLKILDTISSNVGDGIYKSKVAGGFVYYE